MSALKRIIAIVGNSISDVGKGWLTAAMGKALVEAKDSGAIVPIKFDPMLNTVVPENLGAAYAGARTTSSNSPMPTAVDPRVWRMTLLPTKVLA